MSFVDFYDKFIKLCAEKGVKPSPMLESIGIQKTAATNWKARKSHPTACNLQKIADYFGVSVDYLLCKEETNKPTITEDDIKVALFGGDDENADAKFKDVKRYIEFLNSKK